MNANPSQAKKDRLFQRRLLSALNKVIGSGISYYASGGLTATERRALQELRDLTGAAVSGEVNSETDESEDM